MKLDGENRRSDARVGVKERKELCWRGRLVCRLESAVEGGVVDENGVVCGGNLGVVKGGRRHDIEYVNWGAEMSENKSGSRGRCDAEDCKL